MKHLGNITKIHGDQIEPVDCITFGSPCQGLSMAGKRLGFDDDRSVLFLDAARIIKEMRTATNGMYPTFAVWENVPGAFSSNGGEDFRAVLEELARVEQPDASIPRPPRGGRWSKAGAIAGNGWSLAWRQLDAQYWGVPQRRKRIALVADFGGQRAGEILFERESLPGNPDPCIPAWKEIAGLAANCPAGNDRVVGTGRSCKGDGDADCRRTETDKTGEADGPEREKRTVGGEGSEAAAYTLKIRSGCAGGGKGALVQTEKVGTLSTLQDQTLFQLISEPTYCIGGNTVDRTTYQNGTGVKESKAFTVNTVDRHAVAYSINPLSSNSMKSPNPHSGFNETSVSKTLDCSDANPTKNQGGLAIVQPMPIQDKTGTFSPGAHAGSYNGQDAYNDMLVRCKVFDARGNGNGETAPTITGDHENRITDYTAIAVDLYNGAVTGERTASLTCRSTGSNSGPQVVEKAIRWIVRRLTPTECERLQGYPDGWTDIGEWTDAKGKKHKAADSPRYKALGNSIALPQWFWIAQKMKPYLPAGATLGSLFDGIGGFPLVWETTYGKGTARWASEIEEFPIAVTKRRFGEE